MSWNSCDLTVLQDTINKYVMELARQHGPKLGNIGEPQREIEVTPIVVPVEEPAQPVPAEPAREEPVPV